MVIKRVMPRQNEEVNEIWMCDKGRFGYHYVESEERLTRPLVRKEGKLARASWDDRHAAGRRGLRQGQGELPGAGFGPAFE